MQPPTTLHPVIVSAREKLVEGRAKLRAQHDSGSPGLQVCVRWTELVDSIITEIYNVIIQESDLPTQTGYCLVAHGGYGRRDLAPFSDIDLMLLHAPNLTQTMIPVARRLSQMIVDSGFQLGFSVRTPSQATRLAWRDPTVFTTLVESRTLAGDADYLERFMSSFRLSSMRRCNRLIQMVESARLEERQKFGETVYMLQPNVKRSRGALRDIQLVRWIGFARYGEADLEQLTQRGLLANEDYAVLRRGYQYLLRIRNQLHFEANKPQDSLDRAVQIRMAPWAGYQGEEGLLPVEQFMREYFEFTSEVRYSSAHFVASAKVHSWVVRNLGPFLAIPVKGDFRVGLRHVWASRKGIEELKKNPAKVLELMTVANRYNRRIEHGTWRAIRSGMLNRKPSEPTSEVIAGFMELLKHPNRLGESLRRLHELRVLEQIIPAVKHARSLLQFNEYHKYTVDAHSIRAVEAATEFQKDDQVLGSVYRSIKNKALLHLALLLHDLGKGFTEDHSEVGKVIAEETGKLLKLSDNDRETLVFLVHQHLLMTHTAFRFDLSQLDTIVYFAKQVGSVNALQLLFVLSCADLAAVGPGALNDWKLGLLTQLYQRTDSQFRDEKQDEWFQGEMDARRSALLRLVPSKEEAPWWEEQIQGAPANYLFRCPPSQLIQELFKLKSLSDSNPAVAWGTYLPDRSAIEYVVGMLEPSTAIGVFHRITGALSSQGLQILSADVHTQPGQIAWDRFLVQDLDFDGPPPEARMNIVCKAIVDALDPKNLQPPTFRRVWQAKDTSSSTVRNQPTQVQFDNSTSEDFTIISIFAYDRRGLLYSIGKVLYEQELDLEVAKISTHLDQVVDVFYVRTHEGTKVLEPTRLYTLRQRLLKAIETE